MIIKKNEITSIHYMRGIAALLIVIFHILNRKSIYGQLKIDWLNSGVDLFFIISGFVIYSSSRNPKVTPKEFLRRRFIRVVPLYWFFTSIFIILKLSIPNFDSNSSFHVIQIIKSFLFIPHYHANFNKEIWPILIPGWSLNYEIYFYLIYALVLITGRKFLLTKMSILFVLFIALNIQFENKNPIFVTYTNPIILEFLAGIFLAKLYSSKEYFNYKEKFSFLGIPLIIIGSIFLLFSLEPLFSQMNRAIKWGFPAFLIILGCLLSEETISKFKSLFLRVFGNSSYSIYLSHSFGIGLCSFIWKKLNYSLQGICLIMFTLFTFLTCISIGIISYYLIERNLLNFLQNKKVISNKGKASKLPEKTLMTK